MSLIKFYAINDENEERKTSWFMKEAVQTLKDLKAFGLQRLKIQKTDINFKFYELQKAGKMIELGEGEDEVAENGCNYVIADVRISKTSIETATPMASNTYATSPSTSTSSGDNDNNMPFGLSRDVNSTPSRPPKLRRLASGPAAKTPTKRDQLSFYFNQRRNVIMEKYAEYQPEIPLLFKTANIYEFIGGHDLGKAAVYLLRENVEPQLHESCVYILVYLLDGGKGSLDQRIKSAKSTKSGKVRQKTCQDTAVETEALVNGLSSKLNEEKNETKVVKMFYDSANDLHKWIQLLLKKEEHDRGVVSHFLSKFPQIKGNVGLIRPSYQIFVEKSKKSAISDLSIKFRELVPAIIQMASTTFNLSSMGSVGAEVGHARNCEDELFVQKNFELYDEFVVED
uniref:Uncharacterized protein n=1 Tax=Panagrolaimus davidi TaxID=227884 RepID=A0A914QSX1_9BILA